MLQSDRSVSKPPSRGLFPEYEYPMSKLLNQALERFVRASSPFLEQIPSKEVAGPSAATQAGDPGAGLVAAAAPPSAILSYSPCGILSTDVEAWCAAVWHCANELLPKTLAMWSSLLQEAARLTGQHVRCPDHKSRFDAILDYLDSTDCVVNEDLIPIDFTVCFGPNCERSLSGPEVFAGMLPLCTPAQRERFFAIMGEKRKRQPQKKPTRTLG